MLTREEVFIIIDREREYQDAKYSPLSPERSATDGLVLLEVYIREAFGRYASEKGNIPALKQIAKIAAIAVRALEESGGSETLLEGLR